MRTALLILLLAVAGCCSTSGPERELRYRVPTFDYEQTP